MLTGTVSICTQNAFWDVPHCNVYATVMSDLLHQVKSGVWKHIMSWFVKFVKAKAGTVTRSKLLEEYDIRFSFVPRTWGLKHFSKEIRNLKQVTANEYADMMKV